MVEEEWNKAVERELQEDDSQDLRLSKYASRSRELGDIREESEVVVQSSVWDAQEESLREMSRMLREMDVQN